MLLLHHSHDCNMSINLLRISPSPIPRLSPLKRIHYFKCTIFTHTLKYSLPTDVVIPSDYSKIGSFNYGFCYANNATFIQPSELFGPSPECMLVDRTIRLICRLSRELTRYRT